ncbi:hypothetical protein Q7P37_004690 [Cladosporium fusiforme]
MAGSNDTSNQAGDSSNQNPKSDSPEHATNGHVADGTVAKADGEAEADDIPQGPESVFHLTIKLPHAPGQTQLMVSTQEQVQDIRQSIVDQPHTFQYSCFHLEHKGKRINDFVELSEVPDITEDPVCTLVEDPYTEAQARMHIVRVRELIGAAGDRTDLVVGIDAGTSLCDGVEITDSKDQKEETNPVTGYDLDAPGPISAMLAKPRDPAPKTVKSLSLSPWNPPPYHLRNSGHLLYLQVTTNEGEQFPITSHVSGFYVNRSGTQKFDPAPRTNPKAYSAHSLISLIAQISPSFNASFSSLQEYNGQRDPLASYQLSNSIPAAPWLVSASSLQQHQPDLARSQEALLLSGADNMETLRDWNEEFQSTRELPKESVQDRVFRERLTSKLFAEYNEAAVRGACLVARGEVQPLNPTEERDAQIFVYNNVFYSFGADGAGTFTSDGGDEAARVAVGKDVQGVKNVNQMDIDGLCTPGTVVVDYLGKRIVGQSIVPGIFKQRDPGENQIDYGGVEGKDVIAEHEGFIKPFAELSKNMRVKKHAVWDKEGERHDLEASVETKGLLGTDGRKYVLDLYRVTPLDIAWLEQHRGDGEAEDKRYPHRMTVLRPELVDSYRITKLREYIAKKLEEKREAKKAEEGEEKKDGEAKDGEEQPKQQESVDVSGFSFTLNPDVFSGQLPKTDEEKEAYKQDEADVRTVGEYLRSDVVPRFLRDLQEGETGFPMDGSSLTSSLHKRGINVRYLGEIVRLSGEKEDNRMQALKQLCTQEMVSRAFKHIANKQLRDLPPAFSQSCVAHLLNCLLGAEYNAEPKPEFDQELKKIYPDTDFSVEKITPQTLKDEIVRQVALRYRHTIEGEVVQSGKQLQMLREVSLKLGLQLEAKDYVFTKDAAAQQTDLEKKPSSDSLKVPQTNGAEGGSKKKNKKRNAASPARAEVVAPAAQAVTFHPENVFNSVPIVKEASPRSVLAEEALDAGRMSIQQDQKDLGLELLLESLSLHEQIYGILHPEVARVYYALSTIYYSMDEKAGAVELAKKAVIVSERTLGVDSTETILAYLNLSLFEHATGNTRNALALVRHALDLWKVVLSSTSTTLVSGSRPPLSICEEVAGKQSINTATLLFQLAQALALDHDSKTAVTKMRESYNIFKAELGADNQNTKEAETWLETLTHSAVSQAKQAQQLLTNRRILLRNGGRPGASRTVMPQPPGGPSVPKMPEALQQATGQTDQKSMDDLLKYINGESSSKQTPKKKTTNPKKRQQQKS